jgi:hypothetical protein
MARGWPSRKDFLLHAHDAGLAVDAVEGSGLVSLRAGNGNEVRPTFDALIALSDVRELLAPLPVVLRKAATSSCPRRSSSPRTGDRLFTSAT